MACVRCGKSLLERGAMLCNACYRKLLNELKSGNFNYPEGLTDDAKRWLNPDQWAELKLVEVRAQRATPSSQEEVEEFQAKARREYNEIIKRLNSEAVGNRIFPQYSIQRQKHSAQMKNFHLPI